MWWTAIWFSVYISGGTMAINPRNPAFSFIQKFHNIYYANIRCMETLSSTRPGTQSIECMPPPASVPSLRIVGPSVFEER